MSDKLMYCRECGTQIARSAKRCPHCGAKIGGRHPIIKCIIIITLVVLLFCLILGTVFREKLPDKPFKIGETAKYKGVSITLCKVEEYMDNEYYPPIPGYEYILCEFEIENQSENELMVNPMFSFTASVDDYSLMLSMEALAVGGNRAIDGTVLPGKRLKGIVGYEIPRNWENFELRYKIDMLSNEELYFIVEN